MYKKRIGFKTLWQTIAKRYAIIIFTFLPLAGTSISLILSFVPKTYCSQTTVSKSSGFVLNHYLLLETHVKSIEVLTYSLEELNNYGIAISFSDLKDGIFFQQFTNGSTDVTFYFQSKKADIVQKVLHTLVNTAVFYIKNESDSDSKRIFDSLFISSPASVANKNSKEEFYLTYSLLTSLFISVAGPFTYETITDTVYDKRDIELLGSEGFEIKV